MVIETCVYCMQIGPNQIELPHIEQHSKPCKSPAAFHALRHVLNVSGSCSIPNFSLTFPPHILSQGSHPLPCCFLGVDVLSSVMGVDDENRSCLLGQGLQHSECSEFSEFSVISDGSSSTITKPPPEDASLG